MSVHDNFAATEVAVAQAVSDLEERVSALPGGVDALTDDDLTAIKGAADSVFRAALASPCVPVSELRDEGTTSGAGNGAGPDLFDDGGQDCGALPPAEELDGEEAEADGAGVPLTDDADDDGDDGDDDGDGDLSGR